MTNGGVGARIFATHFAHVSLVCAWFAASLVAGARYSNYSAWISALFDVKPTAQIVYLSSGTLGDVFNGYAGSGSAGLHITSGLFSVWRGAGVVGESQLFYGAVAFLALSIAFAFAGWYHNHVAVPESSWFNDTEAVLVHHISAVAGLGWIAWTGHILHVALPIDGFLRLGVAPDAISLQMVSRTTLMWLHGVL